MRKVGYELYQIDLERVDRGYAFRGISELRDSGEVIDFSKYELVREGTFDDEGTVDVFEVLEDLFHIFNTISPQGYQGRSMSVSDIVKIEGSYYYCDSFGWVDVTEDID